MGSLSNDPTTWHEWKPVRNDEVGGCMELMGQRGLENRMDMAVRDTIAIEVMKIILAECPTITAHSLAMISYGTSDAMMAVRDAKQEPK